ncbi:2-haloalkanoic acid dehalogenase [Staphylococcus gallinarum]|uniref:2-haloalkanoic acid dehalogenase n=1 Tax=Staphylococcus gallinarum TaxID=1293 RepID=A0A380FMH7_STAGA|nr:2-haloalkanoic acid dehalogenase [Staphylococcus gallinarum]
MKRFFNLNYYKEIPKSLANLRDKNIDVGILSNGNDNMLMPLIDNSELGGYIDTLISVNEIKQYKTECCKLCTCIRVLSYE